MRGQNDDSHRVAPNHILKFSCIFSQPDIGYHLLVGGSF